MKRTICTSMFLVAALLWCGPLSAKQTMMLIGMAQNSSQQYCAKDGRWKSADPHFTVGFIRMKLINRGLTLAPFVGRVVLLKGTINTTFKAPLLERGTNCPVMQRRSDWVLFGSGFRVRSLRPGTLGTARVFDVVEAKPFGGFTLSLKGKTVTLTLKNTLKFALPKLTLSAHYEGCYGKPGSRDVAKTTAALKPGAKVSFKFPAYVGAKRRHRLVYVRVLHGGAQLMIDLDLWLNRHMLPNHSISCRGILPRRTKKN